MNLSIVAFCKNRRYLLSFKWKAITCPNSADCLRQQPYKDKIHSLSFLLNDSNSNSDKIREISSLEMNTPFFLK